MAAGETVGPRLGTYTGKLVDTSGDGICYQIVLFPGGKCELDCIPEKSYFQGGAPPWHIEAKWELDDDEIVCEVTKEDVVGPKRKTDVKVPYNEKDGSLMLRGTRCVWTEPPPDAEEEILKQMTLRELKEVAIQGGIDPVGCVEREQIMGMIRRGRAAGTVKTLRLPDAKEAAVNEKMEKLKAMEAAVKEQQDAREIYMLEREEALRKQQEALEQHEELQQKRRQSAAMVQARIVAELDRVQAKSSGGYGRQATAEFSMGTSKVLREEDLPGSTDGPLDTSDVVDSAELEDQFDRDWSSLPASAPPVEPAN